MVPTARRIIKTKAIVGLWGWGVCLVLSACDVLGPGQGVLSIPAEPGQAPAAIPTALVGNGGLTEEPGVVNTPEVSSTQVLICDRAAPGKPIDVTVPDGSVLRPGEVFTKTWRLVNTGDCIWNENYAIVWFSGEMMGSARIQFLDEPVPPGQSVDLSVEMIAPLQSGYFQSNWKLRNADDQLFGLGPQGDAPFWVRITVLGNNTPTSAILSTPTPRPLIYQQGELELAVSARLNVDGGSVDTGDGDDVLLRQEAEILMLVPLEGVVIGRVENGQASPSQADCRQTPLSADAISLDDLTEAIYVCYQSNDGLPGYLWVQPEGVNLQSRNIGFVTWFLP